MRIAFFTDTYHPETNGVVTYLDTITRELAKRGHHVIIYTQSRAQNPIRHPNVELVKLPIVKVYPKFYLVIPNREKLRKQIQKDKVDIIHVHTPGILALFALRAARKLNIPAIISFHGFWHVYDQFFPPVNKLKGILRSLAAASGLGGMKDPVKESIWYLLRALYNRFEMVIAPSNSSAEVLRKHGIPCKVLNYGIEYAIKSKKKGSRSYCRVLVVSRLSFEKDIQVVVAAFSTAAQKHPELRLTIVGDGPARKSLEALSGKLRIRDKVTFTGMVERNLVKEYYQTHGIFATASTFETFGYTTAEAMTAGLPIVAVKAQGTTDLVRRGINGFLVKPYDVKGFAEAIEKIVEHKTMAEKFGEASRELIKKFSVGKCYENHIKLYTRLLKCQNGLNESGRHKFL